jgi:hypothetical protein
VLSDIDRANMTAKDRVKQGKLEVQAEGVPLKIAKWNGPRTAEGKQRIAQAQLKHGAYSKAGLAAKHAESIRLRQFEDAMYLLGMINGPKTRGAKPANYQPVNSLADFKKLFANT